LGQDFNISNEKLSDFYLGIENPIKAVAEEISCDNLILITDNGKISGGGCDYVIKPGHEGVAKLELYQLVKKDSILVGTSLFRVMRLPKPVARVANQRGGKIKKPVLQAQTTIIVILENFDINIFFAVKEYTVTILRNNVALYNEVVYDRLIPDSIKEKFSELSTGDVVVFSNIKAMWPDQKVDTLEIINLIIE
jgi:hypothetical protein